MNIDVYIVDAFAERGLRGNPAGVCPLQQWLDDAMMLAIAAEINQSETAFFVPKGDDFRIRWFTPTREVDHIGHATLAAGSLSTNWNLHEVASASSLPGGICSCVVLALALP